MDSGQQVNNVEYDSTKTLSKGESYEKVFGYYDCLCIRADFNLFRSWKAEEKNENRILIHQGSRGWCGGGDEDEKEEW